MNQINLFEKSSTLDQVKEYLERNWTLPFNCDVNLKEKKGILIIDCGDWKVEMGIKRNLFKVSTRIGHKMDWDDLYQAMDIYNCMETIKENYRKEKFNN